MFRILFISLLISTGSFSQDAKVSTGIVEFNLKNYVKALENFEAVLEKPEELSEKHLYQAWLFKGKTLLMLYMNAAEGSTKHKDNLIAAYDCFRNAAKATSEALDLNTVDKEMENLVPALLQTGLYEMNGGNYTIAKKYFDNCKEADAKLAFKDNYLFYGLAGQNALYLGDSAQALVDLSASNNAYLKKKPDFPDFMIGYNYYRSAVVHYYHKSDVDQALEDLEQGIAVLDAENKRRLNLIQISTNINNTEHLENLSASYLSISSDLKGFQLDLLMNSPAKYAEALVRFKQETDANPNDQTLMIAYGNLLEQNDLDAAYEVYLKALSIDPTNTTALYNVGANRVNKGVYYANESNKEIDFTRTNEWRAKTDTEFKTALPYFQKYLELKPDDLTALSALIQITEQLKMTAEYAEYVERRKALRVY